MLSNHRKITTANNIFSNEACANVDYKYGLYSSKEEAFNTLGEEGLDVIAKGLTVGIETEDGVVEYWFKNGTTFEDLIPKHDNTDLEKVVSESLNDLNTRVETLESDDMDAKIDQILQGIQDIQNRISVQEVEQESDEWLEM